MDQECLGRDVEGVALVASMHRTCTAGLMAYTEDNRMHKARGEGSQQGDVVLGV